MMLNSKGGLNMVGYLANIVIENIVCYLIPNSQGYYINRDGDVFSTSRYCPQRKEMKSRIHKMKWDDRDTLLVKMLDGKSKRIRKCNILARMFLPGYEDGNRIYFKDGNRKNCSLDNLYYKDNYTTRGEIWKTIPNASGYEVSNMRRVRSIDRYVVCKCASGGS